MIAIIANSAACVWWLFVAVGVTTSWVRPRSSSASQNKQAASPWQERRRLEGKRGGMNQTKYYAESILISLNDMGIPNALTTEQIEWIADGIVGCVENRSLASGSPENPPDAMQEGIRHVISNDRRPRGFKSRLLTLPDRR